MNKDKLARHKDKKQQCWIQKTVTPHQPVQKWGSFPIPCRTTLPLTSRLTPSWAGSEHSAAENADTRAALWMCCKICVPISSFPADLMTARPPQRYQSDTAAGSCWMERPPSSSRGSPSPRSWAFSQPPSQAEKSSRSSGLQHNKNPLRSQGWCNPAHKGKNCDSAPSERPWFHRNLQLPGTTQTEN